MQGIDTRTIDLKELARPRSGTTYDLCSGYFPGMPLSTGHPPFQVLTYRSPSGLRNQRDLGFLDENPYEFGFVSELVMGTMHSGTHIDALGHITHGPNGDMFGGHAATRDLGDFGLLNGDASELDPLFVRGYLLDIPAVTGRDSLDANEPVGAKELEEACTRQRTDIEPGAAILVRTGMMSYWPDPEAMDKVVDAGVSLDGARWLAGLSPVVVGADTPAFEVAPSRVPGDPQPVHRYLIPQLGIPIMEWVRLEELSRDRVYEFLFVCIPLPIRGATGSMVRPLAVI